MTEGEDTTTATRDSAQAQTWTLSETRTFVYDAWNCIFERRVDAAQTVTDAANVWGFDLSGTLQGAGGVGDLLQASQNVGGALRAAIFHVYDGSRPRPSGGDGLSKGAQRATEGSSESEGRTATSGNITALVDAADASVVARYDYSPFGMTVLADGPAVDSNPWRFSSKYHDSETALVYYGYRYYSPELGRWINRHPVGEREDENVFAFVLNSPPNFSDLYGLWKWKDGSRQGDERAVMVPDEGDTTSTAASFTKLDPSETGKWLHESSGRWLWPGDRVDMCMEYDSPNTVVVGVGDGGLATSLLAVWQNRLTTALETRGFSVGAYRYDTGTTYFQLEQEARGKNVWGLALFGHGYKKIKSWLSIWAPDPDFSDINGGLAWDSAHTEVITPATIRPPHKWGLMVAYFCYADLQPWGDLVSIHGRYYGSVGSLSVLSGPSVLPLLELDSPL